MSTGPPVDREDPFTAFTGDPAAGDLLRRNLQGIADQDPDGHVARVVQEVLDGRRPVRDLHDDSEFMDFIGGGVQRYRDYMASLSPAERARLLAEAEDLSGRRSDSSAPDR